MKRKIIIAGFLIFVIPLLILVILYNVKADKTEMYNETESENNNCINYRVLDSYGIPGHMKFSEIINSENIFKRYEKLLGDFNNAEKFRYIEVYNSLIQYDGFYENGETFIYGNESYPYIKVSPFSYNMMDSMKMVKLLYMDMIRFRMIGIYRNLLTRR